MNAFVIALCLPNVNYFKKYSTLVTTWDEFQPMLIWTIIRVFVSKNDPAIDTNDYGYKDRTHG